MKNSVKDVPRGTANCRVFDPADDSHVSRTTPLMTKQRELDASKAERLGTELAPDISKPREKRTAAQRESKDGVRPL
jgi:hypothetical protein